MKQTGIIMSGNHPRLILDGIKTMTRRVINPRPVTSDGMLAKEVPIWLYPKEFVEYCPYGLVGGRLWVRETHYRWGQWVKNGFTKTGRQAWTFKAVSNTMGGVRMPDNRSPFGESDRTQTGWHKRPSIFMPRWASRILLEITEVRAERLQEITNTDAKAEGIEPVICGRLNALNYTEPFYQLWDSLNAKRGYSWDTNPWVWVIGFKELPK